MKTGKRLNQCRFENILSILLSFGPFAALGASEPGFANVRVSSNQDERLDQLLKKFARDYPSVQVPPVELEYLANLKKIPSLEDLNRQETFFTSSLSDLNTLSYEALGTESKVRFTWLKSILRDNIERVHLEISFVAAGRPLPEGGLFKLPNHERWYKLYSRRFASRDLNPSEISRIGLREAGHILDKMRVLQGELGYGARDEAFYAYLNSEGFQIRDLSLVIRGYETIRGTVLANLLEMFPPVDFAPVKIVPVPDANKDTPPGLYKRAEKAFYFSFFGQRHNRRGMEWLLLHEAIPGHHYQYDIEDKSSLRPPFAKSFKQYGFVEGWGAYVETLGADLNLYKDKTSAFGRLEWDLVRSIRLAIDVGIHVDGWTKAKAITFWKEHVPNQDEIAEREVDRIIRWPAQVISYKTGELAIIELERLSRDCLKDAFDRRRFHQLLLERGNLPFSALQVVFDNDLKSYGCQSSR